MSEYVSSRNDELVRDARELLTAEGGLLNSYVELPLGGDGLVRADQATTQLRPLGAVMLFPSFGPKDNPTLSVVQLAEELPLNTDGALTLSQELSIAATEEELQTVKEQASYYWFHSAVGKLYVDDYCRQLGIARAAIGYFTDANQTQFAANLYFPAQSHIGPAKNLALIGDTVAQHRAEQQQIQLEVAAPREQFSVAQAVAKAAYAFQSV